MATFVQLDANAFTTFLADKGFTRTQSNDEVVYWKRAECNPDLMIKVYTSISLDSARARACGSDAIRVCCIFFARGKDFGICKLPRCHRTTSLESIQERVLLRINEAEAKAKEWTEREHAAKKARDSVSSETVAKSLGVSQSQLQSVLEKDYVGRVGEKVRLTLEVIRRGVYGSRFLFVLADEFNRECIYWSDKDLLRPGSRYALTATVKNHGVFNNRKQSELMDCVGKAL